MSASFLDRSRVRREFFAALDADPMSEAVSGLCIEADSTSASERWAWLRQVPKFAEHRGATGLDPVTAEKIDLANKVYRANISINKDDMRRDANGNFSRRVGELAESARLLQWELLIDLMKNGDTSSLPAYDGANFFSTSHASGSSGTQINLLTNQIAALTAVATGNAPTPEELVDAIVGVAGYMKRWLDDKGRPMNRNAQNFLVVLPTNMWASGVTAMAANNLSQGKTNVVRAVGVMGYNFTIIDEPTLVSDSDTDFYMFRLDGVGRRPFILQTEQGYQLEYLDENSDYYKVNREYGVIAEWIGAAGVGEPGHAAKATLS